MTETQGHGWVQAVTPEMRAWIEGQRASGVSPRDSLAALLAAGWDEPVALGALREALGDEVAGALRAEQALAVQPLGPLPMPQLDGSPATLWAGDREVQVLTQVAKPRVVVFGNLLAAEECDELIERARQRLARSETVVNETGASEVHDARTSEGMFFSRGEFEICGRIERRIAHLLNWPVLRGEGLQVLRYGVGAEYKPHHDYFDPSQAGTPAMLARGGQRVGTLVMYLNTPAKGGGTTFPDAGIEVGPVRGNAVFFSYQRPDPDTLTLHGGAPVIEGEKWVATKWLREGTFS